MRLLPVYERLQRQLEKYLPHRDAKRQFSESQFPVSATQYDPEVEELVELACQVHQLHVGFALQLEERILFCHATLSQQHVAKEQGDWLFSRSFRMSMRASILIVVAFVGCIFGTSLIALAVPATGPDSPLYAVKQWEQAVQKQTIGILNADSTKAQTTRVALANLAVNGSTKTSHASKKSIKEIKFRPKSHGPGRRNHSNNIRGRKDGKNHNVGGNHIK